MNRLASALAVALLAAATPGRVNSALGAADCVPQILFLPPLEGHNATSLGAMSDRGWVVGQSLYEDPKTVARDYSTAVLWRDGAAINLGLGGGLVPTGTVNSWAIDVNEVGVVAVQRSRYKGPYNKTVAHSSWLWHDGVRVRLWGSKFRHRAHVEAVNDRGVAVGFITGFSRSAQPVVWRNGNRERLPMPPGTAGYAAGINNRGLVIGWVRPRGSYQGGRFWYWRLGGSSGPLRPPPGEPVGFIDVDNRDRILARLWNGRSRGVLWPGPHKRPRLLDRPVFANAVDMNDHGDLTGSLGGFRGIGDTAWVSRLWAEQVVKLPAPPEPTGSGWENVQGISVIRGVTPFAPQGGVSVGGNARSWGMEGSIGNRATIWTCTQTY
jgi:hypothetical protein